MLRLSDVSRPPLLYEGYAAMPLVASAALTLGIFLGFVVASLRNKRAARRLRRLQDNSLSTGSDEAQSLDSGTEWIRDLPFAAFLLSEDARLLSSNSTCQKLFSRMMDSDFQGLQQGRVPDWLHPKDTHNVIENFKALRALKRGTLEMHFRIQGENQEWLWVQLRLTAIPHRSTAQLAQPSTETLILASCEDITLFQSAIHALRDREAQTKRLLSGVKDAAILVLCEDGYIQFCNNAVANVLGYEEHELNGEHVSLLSPRTDLIAGKVSRAFEQADSQQYFEEVARRIKKGGSGFWANILVTSLPAEHPYNKNYCMVIRDVSAYKKEEKELHEWKKRFEQLAENVKEAFWIYDVRATSLVYVSPVFKPLLDINPTTTDNFFSEVLRKIHPSDLTLARTFMSDFTLGHDSNVEFRVVGKAGQIQWLKFKSFAVRDSAERVHRVVGVAEDVTEGKTAQMALRQAKEEADAANQAKSEFLANMSHEIRTPLGAIMGFAELIGDFHNSEEERHSALQAILRNGRQLSKIIDEILDLSKVEAGKLEVEEEEIELLSFIEDVTTLLSLQAREKGVSLRLEPTGILPKSIRTDGTKLRQILINIIGNAVKFTSRGSVSISISTILCPEKTTLKLAISDTGPGLDPSQQARLFQPFVQADNSTRRRFGGTGLGLVLSRRLAQLLGGDLRLIWSTPGVGSCFEICLNIGPAQLLNLQDSGDSRRAKSPETNQALLAPRLDGKKILVVDDAPDNRLIVQRFLTHAGASVDYAENGLSGAKMALEKNHDLVVMDIQMPEFDGYQTINFLRQKGFKQPVVALSAHAMREDRERSLASGFNEYLSKPVKRQELLASISTLLSSSLSNSWRDYGRQ